jgi:hypothetical protein
MFFKHNEEMVELEIIEDYGNTVLVKVKPVNAD